MCNNSRDDQVMLLTAFDRAYRLTQVLIVVGIVAAGYALLW